MGIFSIKERRIGLGGKAVENEKRFSQEDARRNIENFASRFERQVPLSITRSEGEVICLTDYRPGTILREASRITDQETGERQILTSWYVVGDRGDGYVELYEVLYDGRRYRSSLEMNKSGVRGLLPKRLYGEGENEMVEINIGQKGGSIGEMCQRRNPQVRSRYEGTEPTSTIIEGSCPVN
jgi:hypothetical protein